MNRPSHWILLFFALGGTSLWWTGGLEKILQPSDQPAVVAESDNPTGTTAESASTGPITEDPSESGPRVVSSPNKRLPVGPTWSVMGRVIDRLGWPVPAARIDVAGVDAGEPVSADDEGEFRLGLSGRASRELRITAPGKSAATVGIVESTPQTVVLEDALPFAPASDDVATSRQAEPVGSVSGLLAGEGYLVGPDGEPSASAIVAVRETGVVTRADDKGMYRIPLSPPPATCTLIAYDTAGNVAIGEPFEPLRPQGLLDLPELELEPGGQIRGVVRDSVGNPVVGVAVEVSGDGTRRQVVTSEGGFFMIGGLAGIDYDLTVFPHRGHLGMCQRVASGSVDLDLAMHRSRPLRIQVVDRAAVPQADVHVVADEGGLRRAYARADAEGEALFRGLGPGPYAFTVRHPVDFTQIDVVEYRSDDRVLVVP